MCFSFNLYTALKNLASKANVAEYGARDIQRTIKREVLDAIAKKLLSSKDLSLSKIVVTSVANKLNINFR